MADEQQIEVDEASDKDVADQVETEGQAYDAATEADQADDGGHLNITIAGEDPADDEDVDEADLGDKGRKALHKLREAVKDGNKRAREAEAELARIRAQAEPEEKPLVRPKLEDFGYDEDRHAEALRDFYRRESEVEARKKAQKDDEDRQAADYETRRGKYESGKAALKVDDFDAAEDAVRRALSPQQQSVIIRNCDNPEQVVYALGRSKKALADLAALKDYDRFAYALAKVEGGIKVERKSPPPAETKLRGGSGGGGGLTERLSKAEKAADASGDYTAVFEIKRQIREAGTRS